MTSFSFPKIIQYGGLLCWAILAPTALAASATSDSLIILEADGRNFTVQHTIGSDGPLVTLDIPEDATLLQQSFLGPNQSLHRQNDSQHESVVQLWEGVALVRYKHRYEDELTQIGPNTFQLSIPSLPQNFAVENGDITRSSYSWVFPENIELISYSAVSEDMGHWKLEDSELGYEQTERFAVTLTLEYKAHQPNNRAVDTQAFLAEDFCVPNPDSPELCATDLDNDFVPDYRDVCLSENPIQISSGDSISDKKRAEVQVSHNLSDIKDSEDIDSADITLTSESDEPLKTQQIPESHWQFGFGCNDATQLSLTDVQFPSGYSYLDISSREALDRLAQALKVTEGVFEIGAHTDNKGNTETNLKLSNKRAETVRYYLLLRGVNPNQVRAQGYGETYPLFENTTPLGRRGNRRVEVMQIQ